jgi:hypothetical protein
MGIGFANFSSPRVLLALSPGAAKLPKSLARVMKNSTYLVSINLPRTKRTDEAALLEIPCLFFGDPVRIRKSKQRVDHEKRRLWTKKEIVDRDQAAHDDRLLHRHNPGAA